MRKHHHNFGNVTDVDITSILRFGEDNELELFPANAAGKLDTVRLDLFPAE